MKQRVSDYIASFLVNRDITDIFMVVGGGAMYLNDSFGHDPDLHCTYNHHEQALIGLLCDRHFFVISKWL